MTAVSALLDYKYCSTTISDRVDKASATKTIDSGSIPGRVKLKTIKIGIHSFPACRLAIKGTDSVKPPPCVVDRWQVAV